MHNNDQNINAVELRWQNSAPLSLRHEDYYFSLKNGLEETRYVYLAQNHLPQRWQKEPLEKPFTIVETGFGTGLNFLATWQTWQKLPEPKRALNFITIEKYPLTLSDLIKSLDNWPELTNLCQALINQYPYLTRGSHLLSFDQGRVKLKLIFGDVNQDLNQHSFNADCWFLDGFSPNKNPSMWTPLLYNIMANHSHDKTTFSSFTAAGIVRKGLSNNGFDVKKKNGFGGKRDMIYGEFSTIKPPILADRPTKKWLNPNPNKLITPTNESNTHCYDAVIIGAGLAGITTASSLAEKGLKVAVIDKNNQAVMGASGQTQLALYVKLPTEINKTSDFISHSTFFSQRYFDTKQRQHANKSFWHKTGLLQLAWNNKEQERQSKFLQQDYYPSSFVRSVCQVEASKLSGVRLNCGGLWFENSGWLEPKVFSEVILDHPNIKMLTKSKVKEIEWCETKNIWTTFYESTLNSRVESVSIQSKNVIIANSNDAKNLIQFEHLPTKPLKGQVTSIYSTSFAQSKTVLCGEGYLCPPINNWHHFGATFDLKNKDETTSLEGSLKNMASIQKWLPSWLPIQTDARALSDKNELTANAGLRCTTPDYMPIVGRAPNYNKMLTRFSGLRKDAKSCANRYGEYYPNLYINVGHGSKGTVTTPIAAELISSLIAGSANPFSNNQLDTLAPARFIIRHLIQSKI